MIFQKLPGENFPEMIERLTSEKDEKTMLYLKKVDQMEQARLNKKTKFAKTHQDKDFIQFNAQTAKEWRKI